MTKRRRLTSINAHARLVITLSALCVAFSASSSSEPSVPIKSGQYIFQRKFTEQQNATIGSVLVKINGSRIVVIQKNSAGVFANDVLDEGTLAWHARTKQWIISKSDSDKHTEDAGGCSDGPTAINLKKRIYWSC